MKQGRISRNWHLERQLGRNTGVYMVPLFLCLFASLFLPLFVSLFLCLYLFLCCFFFSFFFSTLSVFFFLMYSFPLFPTLPVCQHVCLSFIYSFFKILVLFDCFSFLIYVLIVRNVYIPLSFILSVCLSVCLCLFVCFLLSSSVCLPTCLTVCPSFGLFCCHLHVLFVPW